VKTILLAIVVAVVAMAAPTEIRDTGYTGFGGTLFSGRITVTAPDMTTQDGRTVNRWEQSYTITSGVISVDLEPNDTATPAGTSYMVIYRPKSGQAWSERWVVPTSATPLRVNHVRVLNAPVPTVMIQPQQIQSGGAMPGQALLWSGSRYAPGNVATSTAWGGIAGNIADQTDLSNALGGKAAFSHVHLIADVTGLQTGLDGKAAASHGHVIGDVTGLQTGLDGKAALSHVHLIADVTGLQAALDGKAAVRHSHAESDVTGLVTDLALKAALSHVHLIADVTGLQTALNAKAGVNAGSANLLAYWKDSTTVSGAPAVSYDAANGILSVTGSGGAKMSMGGGNSYSARSIIEDITPVFDPENGILGATIRFLKIDGTFDPSASSSLNIGASGNVSLSNFALGNATVSGGVKIIKSFDYSTTPSGANSLSTQTCGSTEGCTGTAPLFVVRYYIGSGSSGAGTTNMTIAWHDGMAARSFTTPDLSLAAPGYVSGTLSVYLGSTRSITVTPAWSGVSGATTTHWAYSITN